MFVLESQNMLKHDKILIQWKPKQPDPFAGRVASGSDLLPSRRIHSRDGTRAAHHRIQHQPKGLECLKTTTKKFTSPPQILIQTHKNQKDGRLILRSPPGETLPCVHASGKPWCEPGRSEPGCDLWRQLEPLSWHTGCVQGVQVNRYLCIF